MNEFDDFYYNGKKYCLSKQKLIYRISKCDRKTPVNYLSSEFIFYIEEENVAVKMIVDFSSTIFLISESHALPKATHKPKLTKKNLLCPYIFLSFLREFSRNKIFHCEKFTIKRQALIKKYEDTLNNYQVCQRAKCLDNESRFDVSLDIKNWNMPYEKVFNLKFNL
jgi:hypothetical protein